MTQTKDHFEAKRSFKSLKHVDVSILWAYVISKTAHFNSFSVL